MNEIATAGIAVGVMFGLPMLWRVGVDRAARHAATIHAQIDAALRYALGGHSLMGLDVQPTGAMRRGRVVLSVPTGWDAVVFEVWRHIHMCVPDDYDVAIRVGVDPVRPAASEDVVARPVLATVK